MGRKVNPEDFVWESSPIGNQSGMRSGNTPSSFMRICASDG